MKINFYIPIFLLLVAIPFFLVKTNNSKPNEVSFIESQTKFDSRDTIKLFEIIDGKEEEYFMDFKIGQEERAYFYEDTVGVELVAGFLKGYKLSIKIKGEKYTSKLVNYDCTWREELEINEQRLELEDFKLIHNGELKGSYFCKANYKNKKTRKVEKVRVKGYFEFLLKDEKEEAKLW